ncbi:MAG: hypothetical protein RR275_09420 [Lachnospiraceae bacterium]
MAADSGNAGLTLSFKTGENTTSTAGMMMGLSGLQFTGEEKIVHTEQALGEGVMEQSFSSSSTVVGIKLSGIAGIIALFVSGIATVLGEGTVAGSQTVIGNSELCIS